MTDRPPIWRCERRNIGDLVPNPKNPRSLNKEQASNLKESLNKFGQCEPIVINTDGFIIGGHQRISTLRKLKAKQVDVCVPDRKLSEKELEELSIRLNKNIGEWDFDVLANEWNQEDLIKWGFSEEELGIASADPLPGDDETDALSPSQHPSSSLGDLYTLSPLS